MKTAWVVVTAILAAAAVSVAAGATAATGTTSSGTNVLVVMNPSQRAITNEVRHVKEIFGQVSTLPALSFFGIYEQHSSDDGARFDRPFVMTQTPPVAAAPPTLTPLDPCRETDGTSYQRSVCKQGHDKTRAENAQLTARWNAQNGSVLAGWRKRVTRQIDVAGHTTEESKRWDLPGTLSRAGTDLTDVSKTGSRNCLVLLGGLAVQRPPTRVNLTSLKGTSIIVTGWRSTPQVQTLWTKLMQNIGATIDFLPADVTDFMLNGAVTRCTTTTPLD